MTVQCPPKIGAALWATPIPGSAGADLVVGLHQAVGVVHGVVNRIFVGWRDFAVYTPRALEVRDGSSALRVHVFADRSLKSSAAPPPLAPLPRLMIP